MNKDELRRRPSRGPEALVVAARWLLAGVFIHLGLSKALDPVDFLKLVREYGVLEHPFTLNLVAAGLPWSEVICGSLLLTGTAVRGTAVVLFAMLITFTSLILLRALDIQALDTLAFCAIKFDCGCGGGEVLVCRKLLENTALALLCAMLVFSKNRRLCLRHTLVERRRP